MKTPPVGPSKSACDFSSSDQDRRLGEEASLLRLCSIYVRDLLQFLPRQEVEQLRQVSSAMDEVVARSNQLPRRRFIQLELWTVRS